MRKLILYILFTVWNLHRVFSLSDHERIIYLEEKVESLETILFSLEPQLVRRYNLIRQCETPVVVHGEALCPSKLAPRSKCSLVCDPGYIETPGKGSTQCKEGGNWSVEMSCEIPLLLVAGGSVDQGKEGDSTVEVISFYPSTGCNVKIPDMPLAGGSHRTLHNLVYSNNQVLVCNGMVTKKEATCDALEIQNANLTWSLHSYTNKEYYSYMDDSFCGTKFSTEMHSIECKKLDQTRKNMQRGLYAAQALHVGGRTYIPGGMVYDDKGHDPSKVVRRYSRGSIKSGYWPHEYQMKKKRAFFCSVKVQEGGILSTGGLSHEGLSNIVEKSVEFLRVGSFNLKIPKKISDMHTPRSGHGCSTIPGEDFLVLVSGGTEGFGESSLDSAEILNTEENEWTVASPMKTGRFGHAVVTVGEKIFAIGGDQKNPHHILDTIEEYDVRNKSWSIVKKKLNMPRANFGYTLVPHSIFVGCQINRPLDEN